MAFNVGDLIAKIKLDTTQFKNGIGDAKTSTKNLATGTNKLSTSLANMAKQAVVAFGAFQVANKTIQFFKDSSQAANEFEKSMITLEIISSKFGVSAKDAQKQAELLGKELRIGVGPAAESIQNLLKSGLNLDQSIDLMKRFTNEAMTGKSANISLSQAVQNLSFAYATGNSALGNMSGISENWIDIIKKGKEALVEEGVALKDITDDQAKYRGLIDLTNLTMGSAEKFTGTLIDKQAELSIKMNDLKLLVGGQLNPTIAVFVDNLSKVVEQIMVGINWLLQHQEVVKSVAIAITTLLIPALVTWSISMASIAVSTLIAIAPIVLLGVAIAGLAYLVLTNWDWIKNKTLELKDSIVFYFNLLTETITNFTNKIFEFTMNFIERFTFIYNFFKWWWENLIHPILQLISAIFLKIFYEIFKFVEQWLKEHIDKWVSGFNILWNFLYPLIIKIGNLFNELRNTISGQTDNLMSFLMDAWNGILGFFSNIGGKILGALVKPFEDAKRKIEEIGQSIKDAAEKINPFHRESPSLVDNVKKGLQIIRGEYDSLGAGIQMPGVSGLGAGVGGIVINMSGNIGSIGEAQQMGEAMGDQIISKLKQNVRF